MKKKISIILVTALVVAVAVVVASKGLDIQWEQIWETIQRFEKEALLLSLTAVVFQIAFQISRLWWLCPREAGLSWGQAARSFSYGQFINTFVPVRAGDVVKILVARKGEDARGRELGAAEATGIILADKVVDTASLIIVIFAAVAMFSLSLAEFDLWSKGRVALIALAVVALIVFILYLILRKHSEKLLAQFKKFMDGIACLKDPRRLIGGLFFGVGCWVSELIAIHILCTAQGFDFTYAQSTIVLVVLNMGIAIPISLANLGTFEAAMTFGLSRLGVPLAQGIGISTIHHANQMIGIILWAVGAWLGSKIAALFHRGAKEKLSPPGSSR